MERHELETVNETDVLRCECEVNKRRERGNRAEC